MTEDRGRGEGGGGKGIDPNDTQHQPRALFPPFSPPPLLTRPKLAHTPHLGPTKNYTVMGTCCALGPDPSNKASSASSSKLLSSTALYLLGVESPSEPAQLLAASPCTETDVPSPATAPTQRSRTPPLASDLAACPEDTTNTSRAATTGRLRVRVLDPWDALPEAMEARRLAPPTRATQRPPTSELGLAWVTPSGTGHRRDAAPAAAHQCVKPVTDVNATTSTACSSW